MTALTPVNPVPLIVTGVPTGPVVGLKEVITGDGITVKLLALDAVLLAVTEMGPVVAPDGTIAVT